MTEQDGKKLSLDDLLDEPVGKLSLGDLLGPDEPSFGERVSGAFGNFADKTVGALGTMVEAAGDIGSDIYLKATEPEGITASYKRERKADAANNPLQRVGRFMQGDGTPTANAEAQTKVAKAGGVGAVLQEGFGGIGSTVGMLAPTALTGGSNLALVGAAGLSGYGEGMQDARASGASPEMQSSAGVAGIAPGLLDVFPAEMVLAKLTSRGVKRKVAKVVVDMLTIPAAEGVTESLQKVGVNALAGEGGLAYDEDRKLLEGALQEGGQAALSTFLMGLMTGGFGGAFAGGSRKAKADGAAQETPAASVQPGASQEVVEEAPAGSAPEAPTESVKRKPLEVTPALQKSLDTLHAANPGQKIRAVEPTTEEDAFDREFLSHRGAKHVLIESEDGAPLRTPGMFEPESGTVFTDANQPSADHRKATLLHEVLHVAEDQAPEAWSGLLDEVRKADPEGLAESEAWYDRHNPGTPKDALRGESVSRYAETLVRYIQAAQSNPQRFADVLNGSKRLREKLRDGLRAILAKVGVKLDSSMQKRAQELIDELGLAPTKDTAMSLKVAQRFAEVIDGLVGTEYAAKEQSPAPSASAPLAAAEHDRQEPSGAETSAATSTLPELEERESADPGIPEQVSVGEIGVDPKRFQFKSATTASEGVRERDIGEAPYDPRLADIVLVWEDKAGKKWIVDGHHRLARAKRSGVDNVNAWVYRETDGITEAEARTLGAMKNLAGGHGDAADVAKLIRDLGWTEAELKAHNINTKTGLGRNALGLSKLSNPVFSLVVNGDLPANFGQVIGREIAEHGVQMDAAKVAMTLKSEAEVEQAVQHIKSLPTSTLTQGGMFGEETMTRSLVKERAQVTAAIFRRLKTERGLFNTLANKAGMAQRVKGNAINKGASEAEANTLDSLLDTITRLSSSKGTVADVLNEAAEQVAGGASVAAASGDAIERLGKADWKALAEGKAEAAPSAKPAEGLFEGKVEQGSALFAVRPADDGKGNDFAPDETRLETIRRYGQDFLVRGRKLAKSTATSADYLEDAEALPGEVKDAIKKLRKRGLNAIKSLLRANDIDVADFGEYLYALHAPDRNALAMARHPRKFGLEADPGSGMSNGDAAKIRAKVESSPQAAAFKEMAAIVRGVNKEKLRVLVESGNLSEDGARQWRELLGPNYISLRDVPDAPAIEQQHRNKGYGSRGKESKRAEGRRSKADYAGVVADTLAQAEYAINRAAHNKVGQAFGEWVKAVDDPSIAEMATVEMTDAEDVLQDVSKKPEVKDGEALFTYKEKGHEVYVVIRDPAKDRHGVPLLARAIKRLGIEHGNVVLHAMAKVARYMRLVRTTFSPEFIVSNPQADVGDAVITIQREGPGFARKVLKGLPSALKAAWNAEMETGKTSAGSASYARAEASGAFTGHYDYKSVQDIMGELEKDLKKRPGVEAFQGIFEWVNRVNTVVENATRASIFAASEEKGRTTKQAARIARETTTPFMRKGEWSTGLGMTYLFFNARVQGAAVALNAVKSRRTRIALGSLVATSYGLAVLSRYMMGQDDEDEDRWKKIPLYERYDNLMLGAPQSSHAVKFRAPRSYRPFHVLGVGLDAMLNGEITPGRLAADVATAALNAFNPIDTNSTALQAVTPTIGQPFVQASENKDSFGRSINPEYPSDKPASEQTFKDTSETAKDIASVLNKLTGGDEVVEGAVSIKPGTLENFAKFVGGGTGAFGGRAFDVTQKWLTGRETGVNEIPFVRKLIAGEAPRYVESEFRRTTRAIEKLSSQVEQYRKLGKTEEAAALIEDSPELWARRVSGKAKAKTVADLQKRADDLPEDSVERAQIEARMRAIMAGFNKLVRETKSPAK